VISRAVALLALLASLVAPLVAHADNADIAAAARTQVGVTVHYDPSYRRLGFPGGDVPPERGVCTDVVVRALRAARGIDLQQRVNDELRAHWDAYPHPRAWNLRRPDPNIDHRRVPNLMKYFERAAAARPQTRRASDYLPGDIVAWDLGRGVLHIGIVTQGVSDDDAPLVVHNIGSGAREEDILFRYTVIGHYRLPGASP
jgi:uncharacterized protein YijF (DUF1287 family)